MVELQVYGLGADPQRTGCLLVLREAGGARCLLLGIGNAEAQAIAFHFRPEPLERPMTHDLLRQALDALGAKVTRVVITDMVNSTYYARILLDVAGRHLELDSRPSDAIALALRAQAAVYAEEDVLQKHGVQAVLEGSGETQGRSTPAPERPPERIDESKLRVFREFIDQLDLDNPDPPR